MNSSIKQIEEHLKENSRVQLLGGIFYFKLDKSDTLVLLFATNIKVDKVEPRTLEGAEVRLRLYNRTKVFKAEPNNATSDLPAVQAPKKHTVSRPVSHYSNRTVMQGN